VNLYTYILYHIIYGIICKCYYIKYVNKRRYIFKSLKIFFKETQKEIGSIKIL